MAATDGFGVDIGGSGIKGAPVDLHRGELRGERLQLDTPRPATPDAVAGVAAEIVRRYGWTGPVGITLPVVVKNGIARTAANIDAAWVGTNADELFAERLERDVSHISVLNDADAAGTAEVRYSHPEAKAGLTALLTFGTGIGSALFLDGNLIPNTEFGHLEIDGYNAEKRAAASVKDKEGLSYREWSERVQRYLSRFEFLLSPDRIIIGGGVSKASEQWVPFLNIDSRLLIASRHNDAGIIGAALAAGERSEEEFPR